VLSSTVTGIAWTNVGAGGGGTITGSVVLNQVAFGVSNNSIQGSNNLWFNGSSLGIGTSSVGQTLTVQGNATISGITTSGDFSGYGTLITNLNASNLASGTVPSAVLSGTYVGITSVGTLSQLNVSGITTSSEFFGSGTNVTNLNASNLTSGTVPSAVVAGEYSGITSVGTLSQLTVLDTYFNSRIYDINDSSGSPGNVLSSTGSGIAWSSLTQLGLTTGSGSATQVAYWNSANQITGNPEIVISNNKLGISTIQPQQPIHIVGTARIDGNLIINSSSINTKVQRVFSGYSLSLTSTSFTQIASISLPIGYQLSIDGKINGWFSELINESGTFFGVFFNAIGVASAVGSVDIVSKYIGSGGNFFVSTSGENVQIFVKSDSVSNLWFWKTQVDYLITQNT
jgi:hypothetical protein